MPEMKFSESTAANRSRHREDAARRVIPGTRSLFDLRGTSRSSADTVKPKTREDHKVVPMA